jgi:hypothetical protein
MGAMFSLPAEAQVWHCDLWATLCDHCVRLYFNVLEKKLMAMSATLAWTSLRSTSSEQ